MDVASSNVDSSAPRYKNSDPSRRRISIKSRIASRPYFLDAFSCPSVKMTKVTFPGTRVMAYPIASYRAVEPRGTNVVDVSGSTSTMSFFSYTV